MNDELDIAQPEQVARNTRTITVDEAAQMEGVTTTTTNTLDERIMSIDASKTTFQKIVHETKSTQKIFNPNNTRPSMIHEGLILKEEYIPTKLVSTDESTAYEEILNNKIITNKQEWFVLLDDINLSRRTIAMRGTILRLSAVRGYNPYGDFIYNEEGNMKAIYFRKVSPINLRDCDKKMAIREIDINELLIKRLTESGDLKLSDNENHNPEGRASIGRHQIEEQRVECPGCNKNLVTCGYFITHTATVSSRCYGAGNQKEYEDPEIENRVFRNDWILCPECGHEISEDESPEIFEQLDIT